MTDTERKERTTDLINRKIDEINDLMDEGYMTKTEGKKVIRLCNKLRREIENPDFAYITMITKYSELFLNHTFLYHPDNSEAVLQMAEDLGVRN